MMLSGRCFAGISSFYLGEITICTSLCIKSFFWGGLAEIFLWFIKARVKK